MKLQEYISREILREYNINYPEDKVIEKAEEIEEAVKKLGLPAVLKAQVLVGGRGKAGGVKLVKSLDEAKLQVQNILSMSIKGIKVKKLLVTKCVYIKKEYYLGIVLDRNTKKIVIMASKEGGVDIEEVAKKSPEKILKIFINKLIGIKPFHLRELAYFLENDKEKIKQIMEITKNLYNAFINLDAELVEINPLVCSDDNKIIPLDAKILIDDNALYRHKNLAEKRELEEEDEIELKAAERGIHYIRLDGEIGIIGNGAGLVMTTLDVVSDTGAKPANFLDIGGSSSPEKVKNSLEIVLSDPNVQVLFINVFGGITRCDDVAKGLVNVIKESNINIPIVVRLTGTNEKQAREILQNSKIKIYPVETMIEGAKKAKELLK